MLPLIHHGKSLLPLCHTLKTCGVLRIRATSTRILLQTRAFSIVNDSGDETSQTMSPSTTTTTTTTTRTTITSPTTALSTFLTEAASEVESDHNMFAPLRGMRDLFWDKSLREYSFVEDIFRVNCKKSGYEEIRAPTVEASKLFLRALGQDSDAVLKELYNVSSVSPPVVLRPEGTAGVLRAVLNLRESHPPDRRLFYSGSMFRKERPQKGRYREFYQFGVECIGPNVRHSFFDVEILSLAYSSLVRLGIADKVKLEINCLGDRPSRAQYQRVLSDYLLARSDRLSSLSASRLIRGSSLRILDSKEPEDILLFNSTGADAPPLISDHLSQASRQRFETVLNGLKALGIPFEINPKLVRGLDYYDHTIFEFIVKDNENRQNTVLAGGRYDTLPEILGAEKAAVGAVGWAAGIDRLIQLRESCKLTTSKDKRERCIFIVLIDEVTSSDANLAGKQITPAIAWYCSKLASDLRAAGFIVRIEPFRSLTRQLQLAQEANARFYLFVGLNEVQSRTINVKDADTRQTHNMSLDDLAMLVFRLTQGGCARITS